MDNRSINDRRAMKGNVQGFELPTGCLMTSVIILLPVLTLLAGLSHASTLYDVMVAVLISAL